MQYYLASTRACSQQCPRVRVRPSDSQEPRVSRAPRDSQTEVCRERHLDRAMAAGQTRPVDNNSRRAQPMDCWLRSAETIDNHERCPTVIRQLVDNEGRSPIERTTTELAAERQQPNRLLTGRQRTEGRTSRRRVGRRGGEKRT